MPTYDIGEFKITISMDGMVSVTNQANQFVSLAQRMDALQQALANSAVTMTSGYRTLAQDALQKVAEKLGVVVSSTNEMNSASERSISVLRQGSTAADAWAASLTKVSSSMAATSQAQNLLNTMTRDSQVAVIAGGRSWDAYQASLQNSSKASKDTLKTLSEAEDAFNKSVVAIKAAKTATEEHSTAQKGSAEAGKQVVAANSASEQSFSRMLSLMRSVIASYLTYNVVAKAIHSVGEVMSSVVSEGLKYNEVMESAQVGIAALIAQTTQLKGANGEALTGMEKYAAAEGIAAQEMQKLKIAGLATAATTEQLVEAYQQAVGPLSQAGVSLNDIMGITVKIVQAAGALGMPMFQINEEVRSIAEGTINMHSRVAKTLGITNDMVKSWKENGTLVENLNKKLEMFALMGDKVMETWQGIKSNLAEAYQTFAGMASQPLFDALKSSGGDVLNSIFDLKNFSLAEMFKPQLDEMKKAFELIGDAVRIAFTPENVAAFMSSVASLLGFIGALAKDVAVLYSAFDTFKAVLGVALAVLLGYGVALATMAISSGVAAASTALLTAGVGAYDAVVVVATVATDLFSAAMTALGTIMRAHPILFWGSIILTVATAFTVFGKSTAESTAEMKKHNEETIAAAQKMQQLQGGVDKLKSSLDNFDAVMASGTASYKEQSDAADKVISQSTLLQGSYKDLGEKIDAINERRGLAVFLMEQERNKAEELAKTSLNKTIDETKEKMDDLNRITANLNQDDWFGKWLAKGDIPQANANVMTLIDKYTALATAQKSFAKGSEPWQAAEDIKNALIAMLQPLQDAEWMTAAAKNAFMKFLDAVKKGAEATGDALKNMADAKIPRTVAAQLSEIDLEAQKALQAGNKYRQDVIQAEINYENKMIALDKKYNAEKFANMTEDQKRTSEEYKSYTELYVAYSNLKEAQITGAGIKEGERRIKESDKEHRQLLSDQEKYVNDKIRLVNNETATAEAGYKAHKINVYQLIDLYDLEIAKNQETVTFTEEQAAKKMRVDEQLVAKKQTALDSIAKMEKSAADIIKKYSDETLASQLADYDAKAAADRQQYKIYYKNLGKSNEELLALMADFDQRALTKRQDLVASYKKYSDEWWEYEAKKLKNSKDSQVEQWASLVDKYKTYLEQNQKLLDSYVNLEKTELQTSKENWGLTWDAIKNGTKTALDDILAHQKSTGTLAYDAWTDTYGSMKDYFKDVFKAGVSGDIEGMKDAFDSFCEAVLDAWIKMLAEMAAQWAASGIASLLNATFNLGINVTGNTGGSAVSSVSTAATIAALASKIPGLSSLFGTTTAAAATSAPTIIPVSSSTGYAVYAGADQGMIQYGSQEWVSQMELFGKEVSTVSSQVSEFGTVTSEATSELATLGSSGASELTTLSSMSFGQWIPVIGAVVTAAMGIYSASENNAMKNTKEYAQYQIAGMADFQKALAGTESGASILGGGSGAIGAGTTERQSVIDQIAEMRMLAEQAGYTAEQIDAMVEAAWGDYADILGKAAEATQNFNNEFSSIKLEDWVDQARSGQVSATDLAAELMKVGETYGLTNDQALIYAQSLIEGTMTTDGFKNALSDLASVMAEEEAAALAALNSRLNDLWNQLGIASDQASTLDADMKALADQYASGSLTSEEYTQKLNTMVEGMGLTHDQTATLMEILSQYLATLEAIPSDVNTTVSTTYTSSTSDTSSSPSTPQTNTDLPSGVSDLVTYYHSGGLVRAHEGMYLTDSLYNNLYAGEVPIIAQTGEYILSRSNVDSMGGPAGVQSAINGGKTTSPVFNISVSGDVKDATGTGRSIGQAAWDEFSRLQAAGKSTGVSHALKSPI